MGSSLEYTRVLAIVLARGGSKGIPRKNMRPMAGVPLIVRAVRLLQAVESIRRVVVSTEDADIASLACDNGAEAPFLRPAELALDDTPALAALQHAVRSLADAGERAGTTLLYQATSPCCRAEQIEAAIAAFHSEEGDYLTSVTPVREHPHWMGKIEGGRLKFLYPTEQRATRRQDLPPLVKLNGAISIFSTERLLAEGPRFDPPIAFTMDASSSLDIDTEDDWERAERALR